MELDLDSLICTNTRVEKKGERGHRPLFPLSTVKETEEEEDIVVQHLRSSVWGVFFCCRGSCVLSVPFLWIPACVCVRCTLVLLCLIYVWVSLKTKKKRVEKKEGYVNNRGSFRNGVRIRIKVWANRVEGSR